MDLVINGEDAWNFKFQHFLAAVARSLYCLGLSFMVIPSFVGSRDLFVQFMGCKAFKYVARFSFTGYLVHLIVLIGSTMS